MQLTQTEIIQILRKRAGLNQAELGSRAFNTSIDAGRTKIKNIELGKQRATKKDLTRIATCLDVPLDQLEVPSVNDPPTSKDKPTDALISQRVVDLFPGLAEYLAMLEKAVTIKDMELIDYLSTKIADIWRDGPKLVPASQNKQKTSSY